MNKKEILKLAKGFRGRAKNCIRIARQRVEKALQYSYRDRRNKKRDMRSLWIERINAGTRIHGPDAGKEGYADQLLVNAVPIVAKMGPSLTVKENMFPVFFLIMTKMTIR
ncbi:uncharacterized protein LOC130778817 isoform X2 [Actinidia eriantha]|uniref:uncharacterized protein LOC130778817 isoform X2 n=1 Tax=Actinidia eriantha TaxID=165200 RepID=UPI00258DBB37|nr:uncharacterized protein LOC130778817 isoform X2 [Actinidia eriantha]